MRTLTVFTPTYNRAHTLPRLFESLERQTSRDFVWFVVDDGSSDETGAVVRDWQASADFRIEYLYQENRGKHNAHNAAVARACTELLVVVDSDDELLPNAVETIVSEWGRMSPEEKQRVVGIWTLCLDETGGTIGGNLPAKIVDSTLQELRYRYHDYRDMTPCFTTAILQQYPFPETPPGMCAFIPEDYVWMRITKSHLIRFLNVASRKVYYQQTGLSANHRYVYRMSRSIVYSYFGQLSNELEWFWYEPMTFMVNAVQAARYGLYSGQFRALLATLSWKAKVLVCIALPIAVFLLCRDHLSGRIAKELGAPR